MAAKKTHAQMDPRIAGSHALLAYKFIGFGDLDLIQMFALRGHILLLGIATRQQCGSARPLSPPVFSRQSPSYILMRFL
jgi:hypothetical protein